MRNNPKRAMIQEWLESNPLELDLSLTLHQEIFFEDPKWWVARTLYWGELYPSVSERALVRAIEFEEAR